ncbi:hypothetical protein SERLA73DRAFT_146951, partial [Serpula lacrymans var. lacrymans S7.3]
MAQSTQQKCKSTLEVFRKMRRSDIFRSTKLKRANSKIIDGKNQPRSSQIAATSSVNEGEATPQRVACHIFSDSQTDFRDLNQVIDKLCSVWTELDL